MSSPSPGRDSLAFGGRVETRTLESVALAGNAIGDDTVREVPVYLPPGWDEGGRRFPVVFLLAGFTGRGQSFLETHPWKRGIVSRYDRAVSRGESPPAILVMPDCFTRLGGSQYVDSSYLGSYARYVAEELVEFVDETYPTAPGRRAVVGKSSGGFGALHLCMHHEGVFSAAASISGDVNFEFCYGPDLLACLRGLVSYDGDPARFLEAFREDPDLSGDGHAVIMTLALSAAYSPNSGSPLGFDLPMDLETGERRADVWERWLAFDPLVAAGPRAGALKALRLLHLECGMRDEFHLQWGSRLLSRKLTELGVEHRREEHDGGHMGIDHRYLAVLPKVIEALA